MKDRTKKRAKSAPAIRPKATPQYNINNLPETILEDKQVISSELFVEICRVWLLRLHSCLLQNYCSMLVFNNLITLFNTFDKMQIYFNCNFVLFPQLIMNSNKTSWRSKSPNTRKYSEFQGRFAKLNILSFWDWSFISVIFKSRILFYLPHLTDWYHSEYCRIARYPSGCIIKFQ